MKNHISSDNHITLSLSLFGENDVYALAYLCIGSYAPV